MDHNISTDFIETEDDLRQNVSNDALDDDDEEEEWCRMCRGPAEEGRPLFKPCKCSGTIGLTHQECLRSWLQFKRGNGRCELCDTKFRFAPKYADGAPEILPPWEVVAGLTRRVAIRWLPFALRALFAASLWLLVLPLTTLYLYQGWLHRPSSISQRWKLELLIGDCISGFVVTSVIIVSFLCLMSFADFLRFHWQQEGQQRGNRDEQNQEDEAEEQEDIFPDPLVADPDIQNEVDLFNDEDSMSATAQQELTKKPNSSFNENIGELNQFETQELETVTAALKRQRQREVLQRQVFDGIDFDHTLNDDEFNTFEDRTSQTLQSANNDQKEEMTMIDDTQDVSDNTEDEDEDDILEMMRLQEEEEKQESLERQRHGDELRNPPLPEMVQMNDNQEPEREDMNRFEPQFEPLNPVADPGDPMDADIHVALDELLGLRGPISALLRNLLWLLAFNTTYLGLFAFIPFSIGSTAFSILSNSTKIVYVVKFVDENLSSIFLPNNVVNGTSMSSFDYLDHLNKESIHRNTSLKLPDVSKVILGYFTIAMMVFLLQMGTSFYKALHDKERNSPRDLSSLNRRREERVNEHNHMPRRGFPDDADGDRLVGHLFRDNGNNRQNDFDEINWEQAGNDDGGLRPMDIRSAVSEKLASAVDCAAAIVKVGVLLFLKMFLFPLLLGIWLDICTLSLFETSLEQRILFAGSDLFGATFIHWVAGITFMLSVTVSVLQLREVVHPDLLARAIRPQEPQRDLLGNLLQEGGITHAKRMILSLAIYAMLLLAYIWLAAKILVFSGLNAYVPFLRPRICYLVLPQLQIPIELLIFHLSMLTFLEYYKNQIGGMQHAWLRKMSSLMGLTAHLLPRSIEKFELVGTKCIYIPKVESSSAYTSEVERSNAVRDERSNLNKKPLRIDPFWIQLQSLQKDGLPTDEFIESHVGQFDLSSLEREPIFETGITKKGGHRSLSHCDSHIRLRLQVPPSSHEADFHVKKYMKSSNQMNRYRFREGESRQKTFTSSSLIIPSSMGSYRLRKSPRRYTFDNFFVNNSTLQVEIWKEVPGVPIPRPPEGWDDLGVGGAEIQGRWAWGSEPKSEIERSVAQRKPFFNKKIFQDGKVENAWTKFHFWFKSLSLVVKIAALLLFSWMAILILACTAISVPLSIGRVFFYLLRIPERYLHDPLAFAIGGFIVFPVISNTIETLSDQKAENNENEFLITAKLRCCISTLGVILAYSPKKWVILQTVLLWFVISPLLLSWTYEFIIATPSNFLVGAEFFSFQSLLVSWLTGSTFLNIWAALCYMGAFQKDFLIVNNPLFGAAAQRAGEAVNRNGENENPQGNRGLGADQNNTSDESNSLQERHGNHFKWQGKHGAVYNYFNALMSIFVNQEYDKIDNTVLLRECVYPVTKELIILFFMPLLASMATATLCKIIFGLTIDDGNLAVPLIGIMEKVFFFKIVYQIYSTAVICLRLSRVFSASLKHWFDAVHKEAREDRYLVGEILLNYIPPDSSKKLKDTKAT